MPWTSEQVIALAPDASSASAGRSLASPRRWGVLGTDPPGGRSLWGECQGSGAKPYLVQIDLSGPAFNCSCPSRKFPCKHGVALLLLFAEQPSNFVTGDAPPRVIEWLEKRDAKSQSRAEASQSKADASAPGTETAAGAQAEAEAEKKSADAQAKRASDREARVAVGLEELDLWLKDIVRQGLAAVQTRPNSFWLEKAARLVDAQAPGVARSVRELASLVSGDGWAERLLVALGKLHLLIEAYRRLDTLPEAMQATVRTRIGWTQKQDELLELPGVSATWYVLGSKTVFEDKLTAQRTWLVSSDGASIALVLGYVGPGQYLDTSLKIGFQLQAELVYYPGSLPLRVAVKDKQPLEPISGIPGIFGKISGWTDRYAAALALDLWLERFPMAIAEITPQYNPRDGKWTLTDPDMVSIPLSPDFELPWYMLAAGGGRPIHLFGEWDGYAFFPQLILTEDQRIELIGFIREQKPQVSQTAGTGLRSLSRLALAGGDRRPITPLLADDGPGRLLGHLKQTEREASLLTAAGVHGVYAAAGNRLSSVADSLVRPGYGLSPPETRRRWNDEAGALLRQAGYGHLGGSELRMQCLSLAAERGLVSPPGQLPKLLDSGRRDKDEREQILRVIGERGRWLASINPEWSYAIGPSSALTNPDAIKNVWETGSEEERRHLLTDYRAIQPAAARALLEDTWDSETPEDRTAFLGILGKNLEPGDEPLLEKALDDRRKEVRSAASNLLAHLPQSALCRRMLERVVPAISLKKRLLSAETLELELPAECDAAMQRDGIETAPRDTGIGERTFWLREMLKLTPGQALCNRLDRTPAQIVRAAIKSEWKSPIIAALSAAAVRSRDVEMARELVNTAVADATVMSAIGTEYLPGLNAFLPAAEMEAIAIRLMRSPDYKPASHPAIPLIQALPGPWSKNLTASVAAFVSAGMNECTPPCWDAYLYRYLLERLGVNAPTEIGEQISAIFAAKGGNAEWEEHWREALTKFQDLFPFRKQFIEALDKSVQEG